MKKFKIGDVVKIPKEYKETVKNQHEELSAISNLITEQSYILNAKKRTFWNFLYKICGKDIENYVISYDDERIEITILRRRTKHDS